MKILKQSEGKIILYSFETEKERDREEYYKWTLLFFGTKTELQGKDDEFWEPLVEAIIFEYQVPSRVSGIYWSNRFKNYIDSSFEKGGCETAKESGISAISDEKEFIIITKERE